MQIPLYTATVRLQIDRNVAKIVKPKVCSPSKIQTATSCERSTSCLKVGIWLSGLSLRSRLGTTPICSSHENCRCSDS